MKRVWCERIRLRELDADSRKTLRLPLGSVIRHFGVQADYPDHVVLWFEHPEPPINRERGYTERTFGVFGTGHPIGPRFEYVGTAIDDRHSLVWHLYEEKKYREFS